MHASCSQKLTKITHTGGRLDLLSTGPISSFDVVPSATIDTVKYYSLWQIPMEGVYLPQGEFSVGSGGTLRGFATIATNEPNIVFPANYALSLFRKVGGFRIPDVENKQAGEDTASGAARLTWSYAHYAFPCDRADEILPEFGLGPSPGQRFSISREDFIMRPLPATITTKMNGKPFEGQFSPGTQLCESTVVGWVEQTIKYPPNSFHVTLGQPFLKNVRIILMLTDPFASLISSTLHLSKLSALCFPLHATKSANAFILSRTIVLHDAIIPESERQRRRSRDLASAVSKGD